MLGTTLARSMQQYDRFSAATNYLMQAKQCLTSKRYATAIDNAEHALSAAISEAGNESDCRLLKYYYALGDLLLGKFLATEDEMGKLGLDILRQRRPIILNQAQPLAEVQSNIPQALAATAPEVKVETIKAALVRSKSKEEGSDDEESVTEPAPDAASQNPLPVPEEKREDPLVLVPVDELQMAWENLEVARMIAEKEMEQEGSHEKMEVAAKVHMRIGDLQVLRGKAKEGMEEYQKALTIRKEIGAEDQNAAESYMSVGLIYEALGQKAEALDHLQKAQKIVEQLLSTMSGMPNLKSSADLLNVYLDPSNVAAKKLQDGLRGLYAKVCHNDTSR